MFVVICHSSRKLIHPTRLILTSGKMHHFWEHPLYLSQILRRKTDVTCALLQGHSSTPVRQETVPLILALFSKKKQTPSSCRTDPNFHSCAWGRKGGLLLNTPRSPFEIGISFCFFFNAYLFLRERVRQSMSRGGSERGRHRIQSRFQALSCQHRP